MMKILLCRYKYFRCMNILQQVTTQIISHCSKTRLLLPPSTTTCAQDNLTVDDTVEGVFTDADSEKEFFFFLKQTVIVLRVSLLKIHQPKKQAQIIFIQVAASKNNNLCTQRAFLTGITKIALKIQKRQTFYQLQQRFSFFKDTISM